MDYIKEVADLLISRCCNIKILSPTDFAIIAEWEKQEIPLAVILKSVNESCDELNQNSAPIRSVADIEEKVKKDFFDWLQTKEISDSRKVLSSGAFL